MASKIIRGLREALSFARGECAHDWVELVPQGDIDGRSKRTCTKCGVMVYKPETSNG